MYFHFAKVPSAPSWINNKLILLSRFGWIGVDLFFVLSGFLITGILLDAKGSSRYFKNFYARRSLRIFPLYYGVLAFFFLFARAIGGGYDPAEVALAHKYQPWYWLYGTNFLVARHGDWICEQVNHFWSLAVEEHFYLFWPTVVLLTSRRGFLYVCIGFIVGGLAVRCGYEAAHFNMFYADLLTPSRMDALAIGGLIAALARYPAGLVALVRPSRYIAVAGLLAIIVMAAITRDFHPRFAIVRTIGFTVLGFFFGAILILGINTPRTGVPGRILNSAVLRFFGKYSYALYVFHPLLFPIIRKWVPPQVLAGKIGATPALLAHILVCFAVSLAVALTSWHCYEKHFLKLKRFFEYRKAPPAPVAPSGAVVAVSPVA
jgi:peptidoglycan/LPS O-acetylase OafA/YrhL